MAKYELTPKATEDLYEIWAYTVDTWSEEQADRYYCKLITSFLTIANHPESKGKSYDLIRKGTRGLHVGRHVVFYIKRHPNKVLIVRILHEKMDYKRHL